MKYRFRLIVKVASFWKPCIYATNVNATQRADILTGFGIVTAALPALNEVLTLEFEAKNA